MDPGLRERFGQQRRFVAEQGQRHPARRRVELRCRAGQRQRDEPDPDVSTSPGNFLTNATNVLNYKAVYNVMAAGDVAAPQLLIR